MRPLERRSSPRVTPHRPVKAKVKASVPARVLDVSMMGMQIELETALRPNVTCELRIILEDGDLNLRATVRRCRAWGFGLGDKDQRVLVYRAGIEFAEISPECLERLRSQLLGGPEQASVPESGGDGLAAGETLDGTAGVDGVVFDEAAHVAPEAEPRKQTPHAGPVRIKISAARVRRILDSNKP
jgi:hypothetical protein